jgi:LPXTG-site transpeptidase (sortase) family protein
MVQLKTAGADKVLSGQPVRIELPRIGLVRDVVNGDYDSATQEWTLTDDKAQYAVMTAPLNTKSDQTLIYGHNTPAVLEPVRFVQPGDILTVTTTDGHMFTYVYNYDRVVDPRDTSVLKEHPESPRVVLMTCEGIWSQTRRLLYFDLKAAQ